MKKAFLRLLCLALVLATVLVPMMASANSYYYVKTANGKGLNVRSNPWKEKGNVICTIPYRSYVLVYEYNDAHTWAYIEASRSIGSSSTVKGWVATSFLVKNDPGPYKGGSGSSTTTDASFTAINNAAKALKVLTTSYTTVIQTKTPGNYVHLRWFPSTSAVYSGAYLADTQIEVLAQSSTWAQVRVVEDGKVGFILKSCVAPTSVE